MPKQPYNAHHKPQREPRAVRYVESILEGQVMCTDGTLVIFVPYTDEDDDGTAPVGAPAGPTKDPASSVLA